MDKARKARELKHFGDTGLLWDIHEYHADIPHRELWLVGEDLARDEDNPTEEPGVEFSMATRFIKNLRLLAHISDEPVLVHMKTCGGDVAEGLAIHDAIKLCPNRVVILSYTHARSMSSIILQAADKRVLMPNSYFMFHRGWSAFEGEARAVESGVQFHKRWDQIMLNVYSARMAEGEKFGKYRIGRIQELLNDYMGRKVDVFLAPCQAVRWGLADEIFDGNWKGLLR